MAQERREVACLRTAHRSHFCSDNAVCMVGGAATVTAPARLMHALAKQRGSNIGAQGAGTRRLGERFYVRGDGTWV